MLKDIKKHQGSNLGGINSYIFIPVESVVSIPPIMRGAVRMAISLKPGTKWFRGYGIEQTMRKTDEQQESEHGAFWQKKVSGLIPKDREDLVEQFEEMKNRRFIVLATDNNSEQWLFGTKEEPLRFKTISDSKDGIPLRNEIAFEFYGSGLHRSPVFSGLCPLLGYE